MKKRHPVRGVIGGILLGLGVTILLLSYAKAPFGDATIWLPLVVFVVVGLVVSLAVPARGVAGAPPVSPGPGAPESDGAVGEA